MEHITIDDLFDLRHTLAEAYLRGFTLPWEALGGIRDFLLQLGPSLGEDYAEVSPGVWVHQSASVAPTAFLGAPCVIGPGRRRSATARLCADPPWWGRIAWWATPWS